MPETSTASPFIEQPFRASVPAHSEQVPVELEEAGMKPVQGVESRILHARGGETLKKGDMFTNPETGGRQIVEHVLGTGEDKRVLYTTEIQPGVREEPGRAIRQLPVENFNVQKDLGGFTEPTPVFVRDFYDIDEACQGVFAAVNHEYQRQKSLGKISDEAEDIMNQLEPLSEEMGEVVDAWEILMAENTDKSKAQMLQQLEKLKRLVARIPAALVKPFPILVSIQKEMQSNTNEVVDTADEKDLPTKGKSHKGKRKIRDADKEPAKRGRGRPRKHDSEPLASVGTHLETEGKQSESYAPPELAGETNERRVDTENGDAELIHWMIGVRQQLQDLDELAVQIERKGMRDGFTSALFALSTDHELYARKRQVTIVAGEVDDLERSLLSRRKWPSQEEYDTWLEKTLKRLQDYSRLYSDILAIGKKILRVKPKRYGVGAHENSNGRSHRKRRGEVVDMTSIEIALQTIGPTYEGLGAGVRAEVSGGLEKVVGITRGVVARANEAFLEGGVTDPDERRARIVGKLGPKVEEGVRAIMLHAGFTQEEVRRLARTLLIAGPTKESDSPVQIGYDNAR